MNWRRMLKWHKFSDRVNMTLIKWVQVNTLVTGITRQQGGAFRPSKPIKHAFLQLCLKMCSRGRCSGEDWRLCMHTQGTKNDGHRSAKYLKKRSSQHQIGWSSQNDPKFCIRSPEFGLNRKHVLQNTSLFRKWTTPATRKDGVSLFKSIIRCNNFFPGWCEQMNIQVMVLNITCTPLWSRSPTWRNICMKHYETAWHHQPPPGL